MGGKLIELNNGKYVVKVDSLKKLERVASAMAPYLGETCIVTKEDEKVFITLVIKEQQVVTHLQLLTDNEKWIDAIDKQIDNATNSRYEIFELGELYGEITARVIYEINHNGRLFKGDEQFRLSFDETSIQNVENLELS